MANITEEFKNVSYADDRAIIKVHKHKRNKFYGPARVIFEKDIISMLEFYLEEVRSTLVAKQRSTTIFLSLVVGRLLKLGI